MKTIFYACLCALVLAGCRTDYDDLELEEWKPITAVPLVYSEITVDDVLTELNHPEEVIIQPDGVVALNYKGDLISFSLDDILVIEDQNFSESVTLGATEAAALDLAATPITLPVNIPFDLSLDPDDIIIDEVLLTSGSLVFNLTRLQDEGVSGTIEIPELTDPNGNPATFNVLGNAAVGVAENTILDLSGYTLSPTLVPPTGNQISLTATLTLTNNAGNTAEAGDFLEAELVLSQLVFDHIIGDFGSLDIASDSDTVNINLFENIQGGSFTLTNAIINLEVTNSFGFPADIELGNVVSENQNTGIQNQLFLNDIALEGQEELGGTPEFQVFTFDNQNSNISPLFEPAPVDIIFNIDATANPDGAPSPGDLNFLTSESAFDVGIDLILPLEGYALDILIIDTIDFSADYDDYEEIDSLQFRLETTNGFPLDIGFQAVFLDDMGQAIDSLFLTSTQIMEAATVDTNGEVVTPNVATTFVTMDQVRSDNLSMSERLIFRSKFNSDESDMNQVVKIKDNQKLDLELGVKIFGNIDQ